jgi:glycosyltransferase involved in cell wall biosynthesis
MRVVQVNYVADPAFRSPDELLDRYFTLTGWSDALCAAGDVALRVVQRFRLDDRRSRRGVEYVFCSSDARLRAAAAAFSPDVVHVNGVGFPVRTWRLRRALPGPTALVVQAHADPSAIGRAPLFRAAARALRGAVDAFLFAADEHGRTWRDAGFAGPSQRIYQVMEASSDFRPLARDVARRDSGVCGQPAALWVGRLNPNKDPLTVLDGFERALAPLPDATLTMVYSTGELLGDVRARIESSDLLRGRVRLVGEVPHDRLPAFFSAADVFVLGSHHEGSGYALLEACASGAIPVVTDIPTFRAILARKAGSLWTPGDASGCARALTEVAARDREAERRRVIEHFDRELDWDAVGQRAVGIYRDVIGLRAKG